jgi:glycosyltransferase involved in cell wall biosynthesis
MVFSGPAFWMADLPSWLAQSLSIPIVFWLHGGNLPNFTTKNPAWVTRVLRRGRAVCAPSGYLADFYSKLGFQIEVIFNIIDLEKYPFRKRTQLKPRILWMRTFESIYNPEMAIEVLERVRESFPEATLTMAGQDRGILDHIQQIVTEKQLNKFVHFAGFLDEQAKQIEFDSHDIYLHTNHVDNMPISVIEAAAFGLPVIATRVGGIPYMLEDGKTGLLVADNDTQAMVQAAQVLLNKPEMAEKLSVNGRLNAELYSSLTVLPQWSKLLINLVEDERDE